MQIFHAAMQVYLLIKGELMPAGSVIRGITAESLELAKEGARELIRRNRMSNPENVMRYKLELFENDVSVWKHDETAGDPILEPTENTSPTCGI